MKILKAPAWFIKLLKGLSLFLLVRIIYLVIRKRSFSVRIKFAVFTTILIFLCYKKGRERIQSNISLIRPDLSEKERNRIAWQLARTLARSWGAMLGNEFTSLEEMARRIKTKNSEILLDRYKKGEKIVVTAAHVGPIDEMFGVIALFGVKVYIPAEPIKPKWLFNLMMRLRLRFGDIVYEEVKKGKILPNAARHLLDGRIVVLAIDMTRQDDSGVICRIGNAQARFPVGAVKLALEEEATIIPIFPSLTKDNKTQIEIGSPFRLIRTGNMKKDIENNTRRLIEVVYAPYFLKNLDSWLRLLWSKLEPAEA